MRDMCQARFRLVWHYRVYYSYNKRVREPKRTASWLRQVTGGYKRQLFRRCTAMQRA